MSNWKKVLAQILREESDANIRYEDMCRLLIRLGYTARQKGSHIVFRKAGRDLINLQNASGKIKPYQVRQVREQLRRLYLL
ncbi:MAG TPA: type II toxin-antitoxin system HicA family toxin [Opitutaceae bacterium]|jgi:predicted RNA binding protein YcfA (HicA-like mRNA interferase family)|nr:type II toxin-antitoxin system HicA family toxin [Opitutaceae bacterium]